MSVTIKCIPQVHLPSSHACAFTVQAHDISAHAISLDDADPKTTHHFDFAGAIMCVVNCRGTPGEDMFKPTHTSSNRGEFQFSQHAEQWLTVDVLKPVLEDFVFNSFVPLLKRKHGLAINRPEGTCVRLCQDICARLKQHGATCNLIVSSAPPFPARGEVAAERYSHMAVLVGLTAHDGYALLDPALYLPRPIMLTKASAYTAVHVWPRSSASDERAVLRRGTCWKFVMDITRQRVNVLVQFRDAIDFKPFFHYRLKPVSSPSEAVNLQLMEERKRFTIVKMAGDASKEAQLLVHPHKALIEFHSKVAQSITLHFSSVANAEFPVTTLLDWIGKARLRMLDLDDPLESISTVAAAVLALSTPLPSLHALNVMRDEQRARVVTKTASYWDPIEEAGASFGSLNGVVLDVQPPWGDRLLLREKTVETRTYPYPTQLLGQRIEILQPVLTADGKTNFVIGSLVIRECFLYPTRAAWDLDYARHKIPPSNKYSWSSQKDFYG